LLKKADQTITWSNPANITYGTLLSGTQLNATVTGSGTPVLQRPVPLPTILCQALYLQREHIHCMWMQQQLITLMQQSKDVSIVVEKADQTITWSNPANITYGTLLSGTQLNATVTGSGTPGASAPGVLTYDPLSGTLLAAGTHTLHVDVAATG
jgi:hypothetical protein